MKNHKKILSVIKARAQGLSLRTISKQQDIPLSTIRGWLERANELGVDYKTLKQLSDEELRNTFTRKGSEVSRTKFVPMWEEFVVRESGIGSNTESLYSDYVRQCPSDKQPLSRSAFYRELNKMREVLGPSLKPITIANQFPPAQIAMIDYSGDGLVIQDVDEKITKAQIFVGVLAHSGLIFCCATPTQKRNDWLTAIAAMYRFFGGATEELWLDNSTSLVKKADKYDPVLSEEFKNFCTHYQTLGYAVAPGKPKHKALAENAVKQCQKSILAPLSRRRFFTIDDVNQAICKELDKLNRRPLSGLPSQSRQSRFAEQEQHLLKPLPVPEYIPNSWIIDRKVNSENQVRLGNTRYSIPWGHAGEMVRMIGVNGARKFSIFLVVTGEHLCDSTLRNALQGNEPTRKEHLPAQLQYMLENKSDLLKRIGTTLGDSALTVGMGIAKPNNSFAIRHLHGLLAKAKFYSKETFDEIYQEVMRQKVVTYQAFIRACCQADMQGKKQRMKRSKNRGILPAAVIEDDLRGADYFKNTKDGLKNDEQ